MKWRETTSVAALCLVAAGTWACGREPAAPREPPVATVQAQAAPEPAPAPPPVPPAVAAGAEEFARLETSWSSALAGQDSAALERLLAPEFLITGVGSTLEDPVGSRAEWLENVSRYPWPFHEVSDVRVAAAGDAAVVKCIWSGTYPPNSLTPSGGLVRLLVTDVWIRRGGDWVVLARHSSLPRAK